MGLPGGADPFAALGLPARPHLTDDDVRSAWRRIAAATHPDRADGGDPGRFALAAAAYTMLRTRSGRGEALADRASPSLRAGRAALPGPRPAGLSPRTAAPAGLRRLPPRWVSPSRLGQSRLGQSRPTLARISPPAPGG